jgi:hypothetical protein
MPVPLATVWMCMMLLEQAIASASRRWVEGISVR